MFLLHKWYFDVVSPGGAVFIGYAARLRWNGLRLRFASLLVAPPEGPVREHGSVLRVRPPVRYGPSFVWRNDALDVRGRWVPRSAPIRETLLASSDGSIDWACIAPSATAVVVTGTDRIEGTGYIERLRITLSPFDLPFDRLRWGRYGSPAHALVWIAWDGAVVLRRTWLDGQPHHEAVPVETGLCQPDGRLGLAFHDRRVLRESSVRRTIAGLAPPLARRLPRSLNIQETKWLSRGALRDGLGGTDDGWAIHEVVTWPGRSPS